MPTTSPRRRRRRYIALGVVLAAFLALVLVRMFVLNDSVHQLTRAEVLQQYRERSSTTVGDTVAAAPTTGASSLATPTVRTLPEAGVYTYDTTGRESIDAVGGSVHTYPAQTTITVTPAGCGVALRWDVLKERHETWQLCIGDQGIYLPPVGSESFHEFFGQAQTDTWKCDVPAVLVPDDAATRPPAGQTCLLGVLSRAPVWEVLERTTRTVGGVSVDVQHVRMTITLHDKYFEVRTLDWYLDDHGLPVAAQLSRDTLSNTSFGDVEYVEHYSYQLTSLTPLR